MEEDSPQPNVSSGKRTGPMGTMRKLVRIMTKLFPSSMRFTSLHMLGKSNSYNEADINSYIRNILGINSYLRNTIDNESPPFPIWGLRGESCEVYISKLLTWCSNITISASDVSDCVKLTKGSRWTVDTVKLFKLKLYPELWPVPLAKSTIQEVQKRYETCDLHAIMEAVNTAKQHAFMEVHDMKSTDTRQLRSLPTPEQLTTTKQPSSSSSSLSSKKSSLEKQAEVTIEKSRKRRRSLMTAEMTAEPNLTSMSEIELWEHIHATMTLALSSGKMNTTQAQNMRRLVMTQRLVKVMVDSSVIPSMPLPFHVLATPMHLDIPLLPPPPELQIPPFQQEASQEATQIAPCVQDFINAITQITQFASPPLG